MEIIAERGPNYNGDIALAKEFIRRPAADVGKL